MHAENDSTQTSMRSESGLGLLELVTVLGIAAVMLAAAIPFLQGYYRGHRLRSAAEATESIVRRVRMSALKEKHAYRVVLHDENATTPNRVEIQRGQGGSWTTTDGGVLDLDGDIRILGSGGTNSVDSIVVGSRGECESGQVYFRGHEPEVVVVVSVASSCLTSRS